MMSSFKAQYGGRSRIVRSGNVKLSDRKFRINAPEGWEEEEDKRVAKEQQDAADEKQRLLDLEMLDIADLKERKISEISAVCDQLIAEAEAKAKRKLDETRTQADAIIRDTIAKAEAEKDAIHKEAYNDGFAEGSAAGEQEGERLKAEAAAVLENAKATREKMIADVEPEIVKLIGQIGEKLLHRKAAFNPQIILHLIKAGLAEITSTDASGEISVLVSEDDYETALENKTELLKVVGGAVKLEIIKDPKLNKSDCVIKTDFGYIDTSLAKSFEELKENLFLISNGETLD